MVTRQISYLVARPSTSLFGRLDLPRDSHHNLRELLNKLHEGKWAGNAMGVAHLSSVKDCL